MTQIWLKNDARIDTRICLKSINKQTVGHQVGFRAPKWSRTDQHGTNTDTKSRPKTVKREPEASKMEPKTIKICLRTKNGSKGTKSAPKGDRNKSQNDIQKRSVTGRQPSLGGLGPKRLFQNYGEQMLILEPTSMPKPINNQYQNRYRERT